ncbi:glycosyltransferase family 4 protein [bacterium]|nr:glycosyltransferase family 4 protein [bacterium]
MKGSHHRIYSLVESLQKIGIDVTFFYIGTDKSIIEKNPLGLKIVANNITNNVIIATFFKILNKINNNKNRDKNIIKSDSKNIKVLEKHLKKYTYDFIIFEHLETSYMLNIVKKISNAITIIDTHDLKFQRYEKFKEFGINSNILKITKDEEMKILSKFDYVIAIQYEEAELLKKYLNNSVITMMHGIENKVFDEFKYIVKEKKKLDIVFFGSTAKFNVDSVEWFIKHIWNDYRIKENFNFHIYGLICNKLLNMPKDIFIHGLVNDIKEVYINADIVINPIRFGSGLKIKNVEAMSYGIPLITTSIGIQGMKKISQDEVIIANTTEKFLSEILKLIEDDKRILLSNNSKQYAKDNFSQNICFEEFRSILQGVELDE